MYSNSNVGLGTDLRRPPGLWWRGGRVGTPNFEHADQDPNGTYGCLQTNWITHYTATLGGEKFPMAIGAGESSVSDVDQNIHIMYHEVQRFRNGNFVEGEAGLPQLSMHDPNTHGLMRFCNTGTSHYNGYLHHQPYIIGQQVYNPFCVNPMWIGYAPVIYSGRLWQVQGMQDASNQWWDMADTYPLTISWNVADAGIPTCGVGQLNKITNHKRPGGKFFMITQFGQIDKSPKYIQGVDMVRYNIQFEIRRLTPISVNTDFYIGNSHEVEPEAYKVMKVTEIAPMMLFYIRHDKKIVIANGSINPES